MRLALHPAGETGHRAGRILLAEPDLEALGIYGQRHPGSEERRATAVTDLAGFSVLTSDDATAPLDLAGIAAEDGLSCVLAADVTPDSALVERFAARGLTLLVAASLPGLAEALAAHESLAPTLPGGHLLLAWTRSDKPSPSPAAAGKADIPVPFPAPVGARWGRRLDPRPGDAPTTTRVEAVVPGMWGGALARVTAGTRRGAVEHLVAAADDRQHLEAMALAAGALALARDGAPPGACRPGGIGPAYLRACLRVGLELAGLTAPMRRRFRRA